MKANIALLPLDDRPVNYDYPATWHAQRDVPYSYLRESGWAPHGERANMPVSSTG